MFNIFTHNNDIARIIYLFSEIQDKVIIIPKLIKEEIEKQIFKLYPEEVFKYCDDWQDVSLSKYLTEDFIRRYQDKLDWSVISCVQILSEEFITEFKDKVFWRSISRHQKLSFKFVIKNIELIDIENFIIKNDKVSQEIKQELKWYLNIF